jgi:hypothetical protein
VYISTRQRSFQSEMLAKVNAYNSRYVSFNQTFDVPRRLVDNYRLYVPPARSPIRFPNSWRNLDCDQRDETFFSI